MAEQYAISAANLNYIEKNLNSIHRDLEAIDSSVDTVNDNVKIVYDEIGALAKDFHDFIQLQVKANRLGQAHTKLVQIRQELEKSMDTMILFEEQLQAFFKRTISVS